MKALWVSRSAKSAERYLKKQGIDVEKNVKEGIEFIKELQEKYSNEQQKKS